MTISSSLNAGVAGLKSNATRLSSISDNIANSSTPGYRRVQTNFESMVISGNGGNYSAGGVRADTTRMIDQGGSLVATSNATDLAVRGRGMLPVGRVSDLNVGNGETDLLLTTTGSFTTDAEGYLTTNSGLVLLGWPAQPNGSIPTYPRNTDEGLKPVQINVNQLSGEPTTRMTLGVNLPATSTNSGDIGEPQELAIEYFGNLGTSENVNVTFTPTVPATGASNEWTMTLKDSVDPSLTIGEYVLTFEDSRTAGGALESVTTVSGGSYDALTGSFIVDVASGPIEIEIGILGEGSALSQLSDTFAPISITKDGSPVGNMTGVTVDANGFVNAAFDTGVTRTIFQVPLVDLPNPNGMIALDGQTYQPSVESGPYFLWDAGDGPTDDIVGFAREESTTDVANELTAMIQTQRAYSSNAKVIQTVDEMLQETTNIKR